MGARAHGPVKDRSAVPLRELVRHPRTIAGGAPLAPIVVIWMHQMLDFGEQSGFGILLPEIRDEFGLTLTEVATGAAGLILLGLLLAVPISSAADLTRRRVPWLVVGAALASVAAVGVGLAHTFALFVAARFALGLALKANDPVQNSLLADYTPVTARAGVYAGREMMKSFGKAVGALSFGFIALLLDWRAAWIFTAVCAGTLALFSTRLREPARGGQERRQMGMSDEDATIEDEPPSWEEALQLCAAVGTLRRIWYATPFLVGGVLSVAIFIPLYLEEVFGLNAGERALVGASNEPFVLAGLLLGIPFANRYLGSRHPEVLFRYLGAVSVGAAVLLVTLAVAPNLAVLVGGTILLSAAGALISPSLNAAMSLVIPPRARTIGFALAALWAVPGFVALPVMGAIGDTHGLRWGLASGIPVYVVGALILASAGQTFRADILRAHLKAAAALEDRRAREQGEAKMLVCRGIEVHYGLTQVLFGVDFDVAEGELVALLGTNGAGKSTLLKAISGTVMPSNGAVYLDGRDVTRLSAHRTAALGVVQVPGGQGIFPTLTVKENLRVAAWLYDRDAAQARAATERALEIFPVLHERYDERAGNLSGGQQQMLTLAQALIARPKLLLIDELSLGLAPVVVQQLLEIVRAINRQGTTVVVVEQSVNVALSLCERAIFLEKGEVRFEGPARELLEQPDILRAVFLQGAQAARAGGGEPRSMEPVGGNGHEEVAAASLLRSGGHPPEPGRVRVDAAALTAVGYRPPVSLRVAGLTKGFGGIAAVAGVSFELHHGEILGLIGANGAGKTTVLDLISGFLPPDEGAVVLDRTEVTHWSADARSRAGLGRSFQDARLFPSLTVADVLAIACERHAELRDPITASLKFLAPRARDAEARLQRRAAELVDLFQLGAFVDKFLGELSTGSRRIVDLACVVAHEPKVLLLDEPSSGLAQRETEALGPVLERLQLQTGASMIVVEHDMPLITSVADRLVALEGGAVIAAGQPRDVISDRRVIASYLGTDLAAVNRSGSSGSPGAVAPAITRRSTL